MDGSGNNFFLMKSVIEIAASLIRRLWYNSILIGTPYPPLNQTNYLYGPSTVVFSTPTTILHEDYRANLQSFFTGFLQSNLCKLRIAHNKPKVNAKLKKSKKIFLTDTL